MNITQNDMMVIIADAWSVADRVEHNGWSRVMTVIDTLQSVTIHADYHGEFREDLQTLWSLALERMTLWEQCDEV